MTFRILVTGSRHATNEHLNEIQAALFEAVDLAPIHEKDHQVVIVHGDQRGVDLIAAHIAQGCGFQVEPHNAARFGSWPECGPRRNAHMVSLGANICLAFPLPGSRGTWDCAKKAADAGIYVELKTLRGEQK